MVGQLSREPRMICMEMGPLVGSDHDIQLMPQAEDRVAAGLPRVYRLISMLHTEHRLALSLTLFDLI